MKVREKELQQALEVARRVTLEAGAAIMDYFKDDYEVAEKGHDNPVTTADLAADRILKEGVLGAFPEDGWLSEETVDDPVRLERRRVWVVDPVDGTKEFIMGLREFAVSVALVVEGEVVLGLVHNPGTQEMFYALLGEGAYLNDAPVCVTGRMGVDGARVVASRSEFGRGEFDPFVRAMDVVQTGSIAYKLALVAAGQADATWSQGPKHEWDICAGVLLVEEAGGQATDLNCRAFMFNRARPKVNGIVATNRVLHPGVVARLEKADCDKV